MLSLSTETAVAVAVPKRKYTLLPVLVVLFLISYSLMAMLVVEQGRTIDTQRSLIRQLFTDSNQLSALRGKESQMHAQAKAQAEAKAHSQVQTPSSEETSRENSKSNSNTGKQVRRPGPQKPPKDTSDTADERRILIAI